MRRGDHSTVTGRRAAAEPIGDITVRGGATAARRSPSPATSAAALIDELPLLGILMAAAGGELRDASELRVKESDRIAAMVAGCGRSAQPSTS